MSQNHELQKSHTINHFDPFSSGVSTSRSQLTPRRDVIVDIISNAGGNGGRDILNSVAATSTMQLTDSAYVSSVVTATFNGETKERETSLQEWSMEPAISFQQNI